MTKKKKQIQSVRVENKKARFDYAIDETYEAGIALQGAEVKSIREGKANLRDSFVRMKEGEAFLHNMYIAAYTFSSDLKYEETRVRKLLLHKQELIKIGIKIKEKGFTLVPLKVYFKRGKAKVLIALAKGKKSFDKRETLKKRTQDREVRREMARQ